MAYTLELQTQRFGIWHTTGVVLATQDECMDYAIELLQQWPTLFSDWKVVETLRDSTHAWTITAGLTPRWIPPPGEK